MQGMRTLALAVLLVGCTAEPAADPPAHDRLQPITACAECHPRQVEEYRAATMAYSSFSPVVHALDRAFAEVHDHPFTEENLCGRCHAPGADFRGLKSDGDGALRAGLRDATTDGITCDVCHRITAITGAHTMALELSPGRVKLGPIADPVPNDFHDAAAADHMTDAAICGTCHDVRPPIADVVTGEPRGRMEDLFSEWKASPWADASHPLNPFRGVPGVGDLHPVEAGAQVTCQDCHMSLYPARRPTDTVGLDAFPGVDPATLTRKAHKLYPAATAAEVEGAPTRRVATHGFFGASKPLVPFPRAGAGYDPAPLPDDLLGPALVDPAREADWLAARAESAHAATDAGRAAMLQAALELDLSTLPARIGRDAVLRVDAWVTNVGAGHNVPAGFSQEREVWVALTVRDAGRPCVADADCADLIEPARFHDPPAQCRTTSPAGVVEPPEGESYDRWMRAERSGVCDQHRCVVYRSGYLVDQDGDGRAQDDDLRDGLVSIDPATLEETCALPGPDANLRGAGVQKGLVSFTNAFQRIAVDADGVPIPEPQIERWQRPSVPADDPEYATQRARYERLRYAAPTPGLPIKVLDPVRANRFYNGNALRPFEPRVARYDVELPAGVVGPLEVDARVRMRPFPPRFLRVLAAREAERAAPLVSEAMIDGALDVIDMVEARETVEVE